MLYFLQRINILSCRLVVTNDESWMNWIYITIHSNDVTNPNSIIKLSRTIYPFLINLNWFTHSSHPSQPLILIDMTKLLNSFNLIIDLSSIFDSFNQISSSNLTNLFAPSKLLLSLIWSTYTVNIISLIVLNNLIDILNPNNDPSSLTNSTD